MHVKAIIKLCLSLYSSLRLLSVNVHNIWGKKVKSNVLALSFIVSDNFSNVTFFVNFLVQNKRHMLDLTLLHLRYNKSFKFFSIKQLQ